MPKLTLFRRKLNIGGDDFVFPGTLEIVLRTIGLLVILVEFSRFHHQLDCDSEHLIFTYLLGLKMFFSLIIFLDVLIVNVSSKGTIIYDSPREKLYKYLYARLLVLVLETLWNIMGSFSILLRRNQCEGRIYNLGCAAVTGGWLTSIVQIIFIFSSFDFKTREHQAVITNHDWEKRCKNIFWCLNAEENKHVFSFLGSLCVQLFKKEDIVASDIVAGLMLVYRKQQEKRQYLDVTDSPYIVGKLRLKPNKMAMSPGIGRKVWMNFKEAAHYMKFAFGSYGWFYYIGLNNPVAATWRLLPKMSWYHNLNEKQIQGDGKYGTNTAAFLLQTGVNLDQIVIACFHNRVYEIPFIVTVDNESRSVIVAVRGTLSIEDILTDLAVKREDVSVIDPETKKEIHGKVHTGMKESADYIYHKLLKENILDRAFVNNEGFKLVITGHSLGAGVASLLAIKLQPKYADIRCFAFAPPGELISSSLVPYTEEFICSVVLGYDIVPRLGLQEMIDLRIDILNEILHCYLPKTKVLSRGVLSRFISSPSEETCNELESCKQAMTFQAYINDEKKDREKIVTDYEPLLPPGQILHVLEEVLENRAWNVQPTYYAEWTDAQQFREIIVSKKMIAHHFPDTLLCALQQLAAYEEVPLPSPNFSSSNQETKPEVGSPYDVRSKKNL